LQQCNKVTPAHKIESEPKPQRRTTEEIEISKMNLRKKEERGEKDDKWICEFYSRSDQPSIAMLGASRQCEPEYAEKSHRGL
jgi:hypothetical protein